MNFVVDLTYVGLGYFVSTTLYGYIYLWNVNQKSIRNDFGSFALWALSSWLVGWVVAPITGFHFLWERYVKEKK